MAELDRQDEAFVNGNKEKEEEEEKKLLEGMTALDFDKLCSTVALQTQGQWTKLKTSEDCLELENGGVFRMWEGEVVADFFDDRHVALQSACCPCYRFGKNMSRAGLGYCFLQGTVHFILAGSVFLNFLAFMATKWNCFLYLAIAFAVSLGAYLGFFRMQIKRKFNIRGNDNLMDDCIYHLICPCCTLSQESRTLEMNNVQDGTWHGRGDICIGSHNEGSRVFFELHPPPPTSIKIPEPCIMQNSLNCCVKV